MYKERAEKNMGDGQKKFISFDYIKTRIIFVGIVLILIIGAYFLGSTKKHGQEETTANVMEAAVPDEEHDAVVYQEHVPYVVPVDFAKAIVGESERQKKLEIMTQKVSVSHTETKSGLFGWEVFSQTKAMVFHGVGTYTVDLAKIKDEDFVVDRQNQKILIHIPAPEFSVEILPEKTEFFDTANGILRFGEMQLTPEIVTRIEVLGKEKLEDELKNDEAVTEQAKRFAKMSIREIYQPMVTAYIDAEVKEQNAEGAERVYDPVYYTVEVEIDDTK